jgi:uncharacterized protein (TIGR00645 family)
MPALRCEARTRIAKAGCCAAKYAKGGSSATFEPAWESMIRQAIERMFFGSRWLLVPLYVTLALSLFELLVQGAVKLQSAIVNFWSLGDEGVLLSVLAVVDLTLTALLVVIVIISGYTNFVTPVEMRVYDHRPHWVGEIDFGQLKLALMASIVAISAIKLLEGFMDISHTSDRELYALVGIHLTFVVSAALLAVADRIGYRSRPT